MNTIAVQWVDRETQYRAVVERNGALWAERTGDGRGVRGVVDHTRAARLQRRHFAKLSPHAPVDLVAPSRVSIIGAEHHPFALYVSADQMVQALIALCRPSAITLNHIAAAFPSMGGPGWLGDCNDSDYVDFAFDAARYEFTTYRVGRTRGASTNRVYVPYELDLGKRHAAAQSLRRQHGNR